MKRITLLFTLTFALTLVGCDGVIGDENDNDDNGNPNTDSKVGMIKSMSYEYSHYEEEDYTVNFTYDDKGRLIKFASSLGGDHSLNYSADGKKVNFIMSGGIEHEDGSFEPADYNCVVNFNNDGNVINIYGEEELWFEWIYTNGYITESRAYGTYGYHTNEDDGTGEYIEGTVITKGTLTWKDGNMTAMQSAEYYDNDEIGGRYSISESFEYGSLLNDYSFDLNIVLLGEIFENVGAGLNMAALFNCGTASKNLVESGNAIIEGNYGNFSATFAYSTNSNGYVTKAVITRTYYSDMFNPETITVNITY